MHLDVEFRNLACSILAGTVKSPQLQQLLEQPGLIDFFKREGLTPIVHYQLERLGFSPLLPDGLAARLRRDYLGQSLIEDLRAGPIRDLFGRPEARLIPTLIVKGTALAFSIYPEPHLRVRGDTDLLIRPADRASFEAILRDHGCQPVNQLPGELAQYQVSYRRNLAPGVDLTFDLHWRISNTEVVSRFLEFDELWERSIEAPGLGARIPSTPDSLMLACVHRVAHHNRSRAVLWLYDIHLLASRLTATEMDRFPPMADNHGVGEICRDSLREAHEAFPSDPARNLLDRLSGAGRGVEPSQALLKDLRPEEVLWMNFRNMTGLRRRVQWLREQLFPPASYMEKRYGPRSGVGMGVLYLQRIWRSLRQFLSARIGHR